MSLIQDPEAYEQYEQLILIHGVRTVSELAYERFITEVLPLNEYFGDEVCKKLLYYPTVTREAYKNQGRLTDLIESGKLFADLGITPLNPETDRGMICGSPAMLEDTSNMLDRFGFHISPKRGVQGDYVIERAFVEK